MKATGQHETASRRFADKPIFCRAVAALGAVAVSRCAYPPSASQYESFTERAAAQVAEAHDSSCARWRRARDAMVNMFLVRGDINGARHADDWMLQQAHAGTNGHLMDDVQDMDAGNPQVAAQHLAAAHAFLPDDVMGQFGIYASGNIWVQQLDERGRSRTVGGALQITPNRIALLLNQTTDPRRFVETEMALHPPSNGASERAGHAGRLVFIVPSPPLPAEQRC